MRKLRKNINRKLIFISVVLLMFISVGYAALSTTLTINGTANISSNSWLIYFTNVDITTGSVVATTVPTTSGTSTTSLTWAVNLEKPGDFYEYYVDVKNDGTIDAMIGNLSNSSLTANQEKYLDYTVTYSDGAVIELYDKLDAEDMVTLKVRVEYKTDLNPEDLPSENSAVILTYTSTYVQADGNAKERNERKIPVNYAVQIYGINEDVDANGELLGLTFGPAAGDDYNKWYYTHTYEETSNGSGMYYLKRQNHYIYDDGTEVVGENYVYKDAGKTEKIIRTAEEKNKYDISLHDMTWAEISNVSDKTDFLDCFLCGDTKKVELALNSKIRSGVEYQDRGGDGTSTLYQTIKSYFRMWNPSFNSQYLPDHNNLAIGTGVILNNDELGYGSNGQEAGGYSSSHIRATLIGINDKTNIGYAGDINLGASNCLYSCLPSDLKNVITAKKIRYVTGTSENDYSLNEDIADKIWLMSEREVFGTGENGGNTAEGLGNDGHGYGIFTNAGGMSYIPAYKNNSEFARRYFREDTNVGSYILRTVDLKRRMISYMTFNGQVGPLTANIAEGLSFGFCIK